MTDSAGIPPLDPSATTTLLRNWSRPLRYFWASPATVVGLICGLIAKREGSRWRVVDGVIEIPCPRLLRRLSRSSAVQGGIRAMTLGHVVLGTDLSSLATTRAHERVHVRQYERWGPFFIPAYLLCSVWLAARGKHPYLDNPFEVEAYRIAD